MSQQQPSNRNPPQQPSQTTPKKAAPQRPVDNEEDDGPWICRGVD